jgi:FkbM family methyltransferase
MPTLYRRLLNVLPHAGVRVVNLGPGAALVTRRRKGGRDPSAVSRKRAEAWMASHGETSETSATGKWEVVPLGETGEQLVVDATASDEQALQLAAASYLVNHHVAGLLAKYKVNCVFDVGANSGQYATRLRALGYTGRIVSFEPTSEAFAKLQEAAADDPEWHVNQVALGREETTQSMHVDWSTMNSLLPASDYGKDRYRRFGSTRTEEIQIRRLDDVLPEALAGLSEPRPYLKMDTQGFDLEVFAGAGERINDFIGMQSEVAALRLYEGSPSMSDAIAAYEDSGFAITGMYPVTREKTTGRVVEFDCVMMRASAAPALSA